ncbi:hypothetical protein [Erwinia endophytica]|uniref:hypothetical protein n=1 Tax=Erwinia endophytica TaxID=1563158 RepID=UPI00186B6F06|nr:hypothetical protein [Erwinia endophytica]
MGWQVCRQNIVTGGEGIHHRWMSAKAEAAFQLTITSDVSPDGVRLSLPRYSLACEIPAAFGEVLDVVAVVVFSVLIGAAFGEVLDVVAVAVFSVLTGAAFGEGLDVVAVVVFSVPVVVTVIDGVAGITSEAGAADAGTRVAAPAVKAGLSFKTEYVTCCTLFCTAVISTGGIVTRPKPYSVGT